MASGPTIVHAARIVAGVVPALLVVAFSGFVAALALLMKQEHRQYALDFTRICVDLAAVLVGAGSQLPSSQTKAPVDSEDHGRLPR